MAEKLTEIIDYRLDRLGLMIDGLESQETDNYTRNKIKAVKEAFGELEAPILELGYKLKEMLTADFI